ncbi:hypothetical protein Tco_1479715 [Tanacetum coccineum]
MYVHGFTDNEYQADDDQPTLISKLDLSSPLHLHPNDYTTLTVVFVKLKGRQWDRVNAVVLKTYDKVDDFVTFNLHHKINSLSQNGSSIADYYHRLNALWKQFDALFLMGLDDCYMQIRSDILSRDELPDVRSAYSIISSEESHRVVFSFGSGNSQRSQSSVFNSNVGNKNNAQRPQASISNSRPANVTRPVNNRNRRRNWGSTLVCEHCGFHGHTIDRCFNSNSFSDDHISKLITLIKENSLNSTGKVVQANMVGANQHLTYTDKDLVNVIDISYLGITVSHLNGTEACITKVRNMVLNKFLTLHDVLVVPEYCMRLMLVHKLARDSTLIVAFDESKCFVLP